MDTQDFYNHLHTLEVSLHSVETRSDINQLDMLLHSDFLEFGRSGKIYRKTDVLDDLPKNNVAVQIVSRDYTYEQLEEGVVLLTYKSANINDNNEETRLSLRSSIWQRTEQGWQLRFHQGTPLEK